jgi:hypothetical protein
MQGDDVIELVFWWHLGIFLHLLPHIIEDAEAIGYSADDFPVAYR